MSAVHAIDTVKPRLAEVGATDELAEILEREAQARWLSRGDLPEVSRYFDDPDVLGALSPGFQRTCSPGARPDLTVLPEAPGRNAVIADIEHLVDILATLLEPPLLGLRLEVLDRAMCPRFHVDRVGLRLLCTYRGPATQLLDDAGADRRWLGQAGHGMDDERSGLVRDPRAVVDVPRFAILLMKGAGWPGNEHLGAIHRSPRVSVAESPRILLALDAIWN